MRLDRNSEVGFSLIDAWQKAFATGMEARFDLHQTFPAPSGFGKRVLNETGHAR
jgi:hypothetical protein